MAPDTCRQQHTRILLACDQVRALLDRDNLAVDGSAIREALRALGEAVEVHLRVEDGHLYPLLADSHDPLVRDAARTFQEQMGSVGVAWAGHLRAWGRGRVIEEDPARFVRETFKIVAVIVQRVGLEEAELYPLAATGPT